MRIHDPKLRNMVHALSLSVFFAFKGLELTFIFLFSPVSRALFANGKGKYAHKINQRF